MPKPNQVEQMVWPSACAKMLGVQVSMISAAKKMMGIERKKVFPSEMENFFKVNRDFTLEKAYPRKVAT